MRKDELRKLRALPATKEMLQKAKENSGYKMYLRIQNLSQFIKIAVFLRNDMKKDISTPRYEIFLNVPGEEFITRELDKSGNEVRWSNAMIQNLDGPDGLSWWTYRDTEKDAEKQTFLNADAKATLNRLPLQKDNGSKGVRRLRAWQQQCRSEAIKRQEAREQKPWDEDMALIPEVTASFKEWMRKDAADEYFIIYHYERKGAKTGYCSRCKKVVPIKEPKHLKETRCPACGVKATFRADSKIQTLSAGWYYADIIQKFNGGIVIRTFEQHQGYARREYTDPDIYTHEKERLMIFDDGTQKRYTWGLYKNKFNRWILDKEYFKGKRVYGYSMEKRKLYRKNFAYLKKHSMLKQSAIELWPTLPCCTVDYLTIESGNPAVEKLARLSMFRLAEAVMVARYDKDLFCENATELAKMLKIDNSRLKRLKDMNANLYSLKWMQQEKQENTIWPDQLIKELGEANIAPDHFAFLKYPMSAVKCFNYLKKQAELSGDTLSQTLNTWRDYMNMAQKLKMDIKLEQIAKPKNLKAAHDECVRLKERAGVEKQAKELKKKWPKVEKQLPKLQKFEYAAGDYVITVPKTVTDIVMEGTILRHCVHTCDYYFSRIQDDESYLFFLRKKESPDMPWYTLEVEPSGNIRQKRTTGDNQNEDFKKALPFLKKWQQFFKKQLTAEEKALGDRSNLLREENYKNLRKNGNRVWHGRLAGQLLADVLEEDFMAAVGG